MLNINLNNIPIFGWILSFIWNSSLSVPFWLCWTYFGVGEKYFYWLPPVYRSIPFGSCIALFISISILGSLLQGFVPKIVFVSSSSNANMINKKESEDVRQG